MSDVIFPNVKVNLIGKDGNAFLILGLCNRARKKANLPDTEWENFKAEAMDGDYDHLLQTVMKWFSTDEEPQYDDD